MKLDKSILGVAGEFAVSAELCRRNIYAQPTFGNQKRVDLLAFSPTGRLLRIEVKTKQGPVWPNCRGIRDPDTFLVFVALEARGPVERPGYYVLSAEDWRTVAQGELERYRAKHPDRRVHLTHESVLVLPDEVGKTLKPYEGCSIRPDRLTAHQDAWHKIELALQTIG
jgi:hypothetical protein